MAYYSSYNLFDNKSEVFIYVEKYSKENNYVLFDFIDSNEFNFFSNTISSQYDWETRPTMAEVINYNQRSLQEGVTYRITYETLIYFQQRIQVVEDSLIIGFRITLNDADNTLFGPSKSFNETERFWRNMDDSFNSELHPIIFDFGKINQVIVRNIGQGNWNEIKSNERFTLIFDAGTIYTTKRIDVFRLIGDRDNQYQKSNPIIIISHWDVDHYHFLIGFQDDTIKSIPIFIYRAAIPNLTARKVLGRFRSLNANALLPIAPIDPSPLRSSTKLRKFNFTTTGNIIFF